MWVLGGVDHRINLQAAEYRLFLTHQLMMRHEVGPSAINGRCNIIRYINSVVVPVCMCMEKAWHSGMVNRRLALS